MFREGYIRSKNIVKSREIIITKSDGGFCWLGQEEMVRMRSSKYQGLLGLQTRLNSVCMCTCTHIYTHMWGFPGSSAGKESTCNAGDPSSITGLGRSPGEGIGYPPQYYWASLVAQLVKSPPTMWEMGSIPRLQRSPREGNGYPLQHSGLENPMDCIAHGITKSRTQLSDFQFHTHMYV